MVDTLLNIKRTVSESNDYQIPEIISRYGRQEKNFTPFPPIFLRTRAQKKRIGDRILANKLVTWRVYWEYFKYNKHSVVQTILVSGVASLAVVIGATFLAWGVNEHLEAEAMFRGLSPTQLCIPVLVTGSLFMLSGTILYISFATRLRHLVFVSIPAFALSFMMTIFLVIWILKQTSAHNVRNYLKHLIHSYRFISNDKNTLLMDKLQEHFSCCGVTSPRDWIVTGKFPSSNLPTSCCLFSLAAKIPTVGLNNRTCEYTASGQYNWALQPRGCAAPLRNFLTSNDVKGWASITIGFLSVFLATILIMFHLKQTCTRLSWIQSVKPELRRQLVTLIDGAIDSAECKDKSSNLDMKEFILRCLNKCVTKDEVKTLLETLADAMHYIKEQEPEGLVFHILQGKPKLIIQFETVDCEARERGKRKVRPRIESTVPANSAAGIVSTTNIPTEPELLDSAKPSVLTVPLQYESLTSPTTSSLVSSMEIHRRLESAEKFLNDFRAFTRGKLRKKIFRLDFAQHPRYLRSISGKQFKTDRGNNGEKLSISDHLLAQNLGNYRKWLAERGS